MPLHQISSVAEHLAWPHNGIHEIATKIDTENNSALFLVEATEFPSPDGRPTGPAFFEAQAGMLALGSDIFIDPSSVNKNELNSQSLEDFVRNYFDPEAMRCYHCPYPPMIKDIFGLQDPPRAGSTLSPEI